MVKKNNILYVLHSLAGGTYYTTLDLIKHVQNEYNVFILGGNKDNLILYEYKNNDLKIISTYNRNSEWSPKVFHDSWLTYLYYEILTQYNIQLVHVRHLIYHSFDLPQIAKKLDIPIVLSFHDFYFLCPNYLLLNENEEYCELHCSQSNKNCKLEWDLFDGIHFKTILLDWRTEVQNLFKNVDVFITTSDIVKNLYLSVYTNTDIINDDNFHVFEHGRDFFTIKEEIYEIPSKNDSLKIVFPANQINNSKGLEIIKKLKSLDVNDNLEFHFLGNSTNEINEYGIIHGPYKREDFCKKIKSIKPSFIGIFSTWPETFCHTLTEAWSCGIPVIGTDIGVIQDRILKNNGGFIIERFNLNESYKKILKFKNSNEKDYLTLVENVSKINFKTSKEMADEYVDVYKHLTTSN